MPRRPDLPPLPEVLRQLARACAGVVTTREALAEGLTKAQLDALCRAGTWARAARGAYVVEGFLASGGPTELQQAWAAWLVAGAQDVVAGPTGWRLHGLDGAPPDGRVELAVLGGSKRQPPHGVHLRWDPMLTNEVTTVGVLPVASVHALLVDASRRATREVFVSMLDSALRHRRTDADGLLRLRSDVGERARGWVDLSDGRSESPLETRLRLIAHDADLAPTDLQHVVKRGGNTVARIDLVWIRRSLKLAVEADGKGPHSLPEALYRDRRRQADLSALGWVVLRFTWDDVVHRPKDVLDQIRRHLLLAA